MRRFIATMPGKLVCQLVIFALMLPSITLMMMGKAYAQTAVNPTWAVVEFVVRKAPGTEFGKEAAAAFSNELGKSGRYDVVSQEQLGRAIESLGVQSPPRDNTTLLRIAQEVKASTVISGDVVDYRVVSDANGKKAFVSLRAVVYDVASGLPVNGSAVSATSTTRPASTDDKVVISDAIGQAAASAYRDIQSKTLVTATVLNTTVTRALINQGTRAGFKQGQEVIITRGREQVASARIVEVDFDSSTVRIERSLKGVTPGDIVRPIYPVPNIVPGFSGTGEATVSKPRKGISTSTIITTLIVVGVLALLLGGGNGGSNGNKAASGVIAQPILEANSPAVFIDWAGFGSVQGGRLEAWNVFRSDVADAPVVVVQNGGGTSAVDRLAGRTVNYSRPPRVIVGDPSCNGLGTATAIVPGIRPGFPYQYSVEAILIAERPPGGSTTTTGTTATQFCYLRSDQTPSLGTATPLNPPQPSSPAAGANLVGNQDFVFTPGTNGNFGGRLEYVLQVSTNTGFDRNNTVTVARISDGTNRFRGVNVNNLFANNPTTDLFYRIGVRNLNDNPGPRPDASGEPYIFGGFRLFKRPAGPPPPP